MRVRWSEIKETPKDLSFDQKEDWVKKSVHSLDEHPNPKWDPIGSLRPNRIQQRTITATFSLRRIDEIVEVKGHFETKIQLICSRCANSFWIECSPHFTCLFGKDPSFAGVGYLDWDEHGNQVPAGTHLGKPIHGQGESDLDITYLAGNEIDLSDILKEQLRLALPFQPLCSGTCKGICPNCGEDLNRGSCSCKSESSLNPFSVLKKLKGRPN